MSSAEEIARQRREKVEKWRRERLAKEQQEANPVPTSEQANGGDVNGSTEATDVMQVDSVPMKRKAWSLEDEDDDDDDNDEGEQPPPKETIPAPGSAVPSSGMLNAQCWMCCICKAGY
jgi:hypothetical protein